MSNSTEDLLDELSAIESNSGSEIEERPVSQADHLLNTLQASQANGAKQQPSTEPDSPESASSDNGVDDLLDLIEEDKPGTDSPMMQKEGLAPKSQPSSTQDQGSEDPSTIEAAALALEAAKAAQEAAENSQKSSEIALKNAHELKAQVLDLSDSNFAWRQTVRTATKEIQSARNMVSILATISIVFSFAAAGIMGYYLYSLNKKYEQLKGDVLDIIQTESALFQKKFNTKVDELSSLIEYLSSQVEKLKVPAAASLPQANVTIVKEEETHDEPATHALPEQVAPQENTHVAPHQGPMTAHSETTPQHAEIAHHSDHETPSMEMHHKHEAPQSPLSTSAHPINSPTSEQPSIDPEKFNQIIATVNEILHKQQDLEKTLQQQIQSQHVTVGATNGKVVAKLAPEDEKKLNGIRWLIKQQMQRIKVIESALKNQGSEAASSSDSKVNLNAVTQSLKELKNQVNELRKQQLALQQEVLELKKETQKLAGNRPYYYRAPE
jgi:hypothetical protein